MAPLSSNLSQSRSRSSLISDTTYHSFHDIELYEPSVSSTASNPSTRTYDFVKDAPHSTEMRRQDSGYESITPRAQVTRRRTSNASSSTTRSKPRPSVRRSTKSGPIAHVPRASAQKLHHSQSHQGHVSGTYFPFPSPDPQPCEGDPLETHYTTATTGASSYTYSDGSTSYETSDALVYSAPPQTTHYWTSDKTRRLEYAAIDAASRGVKGWMMRHMVPDCFVPKERRRIGFDDDTGSVRRYRLELETEESAEKDDFPHGKKKRAWTWGSST